jgi:hypothetical protein
MNCTPPPDPHPGRQTIAGERREESLLTAIELLVATVTNQGVVLRAVYFLLAELGATEEQIARTLREAKAEQDAHVAVEDALRDVPRDLS